MILKEALKNYLSENELKHIIRAYDVIGDIAITIIPPELEQYESVIGNKILELNKNVKVVAKRDGFYTGKYRTIPLTVIAGENRKKTICKEFGVKLHLNPEKVYYSIRSGNERKRIADQVTPGENILVMFSGIGVYPLIIAKHSSADHIIGIELNPDAHAFGMENLVLNKVDNITLYHGDVKGIIPSLHSRFDRIIMPLPQSASSYIPLALSVLKKNGLLHVYDFQPKESFQQSLKFLREQCKLHGRELLTGVITPCGHKSPSQYRICIDGTIA